MIVAPPIATRRRTSTPAGLRVAVALALPFVGAVTVIGIFLGKEVIVAAALLALCMIGFVLVRPLVGVLVMTSGFLLAAYPSALQTLGILTLNNLLGVCLGVLLVARVLSSRDLSFLGIPQVMLLAAIGAILVLSTAHADQVFPTLQASAGLGSKGKLLDRTSDMMHDFWTRLLFLIFFCVFVRTRSEVGLAFKIFMFVLFCAIPSALFNWTQGTLAYGFRAAASFTQGANANRLAMICLMEVACFYLWARATRGTPLRLFAVSAIGASLLVSLATGSRSGLIGLGVLTLLLQSGPRVFRASITQLGAATAVGALAVVTIVPPMAWQRALNVTTEDPHEVGSSSVVKRETTIGTGMQMVQDHPLLGVGLGNFREVSRQIYHDKFFRPPHNSFLWAAAEGGIIVFAGYMALLAFCWYELRAIGRLVARDPSVAYIAAALRIVFLLYCFFAAFADLFLNPIIYVLVGLIVTLHRYLESVPAFAASPVTVPVRRRTLVTARR
jgi:O-antigen ligase